MSHKTKMTGDRIAKFLELIANNGGIVFDAAKQLNISRTALYQRRKEDEGFKKAWGEAVDRGVDVIEDEAKRRALKGCKEAIYYEGKIVGYKMVKSDYCIGIVLKAHRPAYRERHEITGPGGGPLVSNVTVYLPDNKRHKKIKKRKAK